MISFSCISGSSTFSWCVCVHIFLQSGLVPGTSEAIVITQSGHVVVVSGLVLTIAYGSLLVLPGVSFWRFFNRGVSVDHADSIVHCSRFRWFPGAFKSFCIAACSMILCPGPRLATAATREPKVIS